MLVNILFFIVSIGIIIIVHELGHLIVAKRNGVHCHTFSIGMGPAIKQFYTDKSGTTYFLRAIPLGGFVVLAGEEADNALDIEIPEDKKIDNKSKWVRFKIFFAGSFMNILLCVFLLTITNFFGGVANTDTTQITVLPDSPMEVAGINTGDTITEVNDVEVSNYDELITEVGKSDSVTLTTSESEEFVVSRGDDGYYGFSPYTDKFELIPSIFDSIMTTVLMFFSIFISIIALFTPVAGIDDLAGPVGIASAGGQVVSLGWVAAVNWIAYLSVNIGFVNLLPIPVTDGGRIMFIIYEAIRRKKPSKKVENNLIIGSALVMLFLFVYITFNDIIRIIGG